MRRSRRHLLLALAFAFALLIAIAVLPGTDTARAITITTPTTALSRVHVDAENVTYTFSGYRTPGNQFCTGVAVTFPNDTDVSGATAVTPAGTVDVSGQTVTYTFTNAIVRNIDIIVSIGGITNPPTAVTRDVGNMTFFLTRANGNPLPEETHPTGAYSIFPPYLSLSVNPASMTFDLYPETTATPQPVTVDVDSSHPFTITRQIIGHEPIGLAVTGQANGAFGWGASTLIDEYTASPPWTTEGDRDYTATVTYTVVQNY